MAFNRAKPDFDPVGWLCQTLPHTALDYVRPDEVAECWEGVSEELYKALWDMVPRYEKVNMEDNGPHDVIGINSVKTFWQHFSAEHQKELNKLAMEGKF